MKMVIDAFDNWRLFVGDKQNIPRRLKEVKNLPIATKKDVDEADYLVEIVNDDPNDLDYYFWKNIKE